MRRNDSDDSGAKHRRTAMSRRIEAGMHALRKTIAKQRRRS
jgi:hypothetical protein